MTSERPAKRLVRRRIQLGLEFRGGAPCLIHQRWIQQKRRTVDKRAGGRGLDRSRRLALRLRRGERFIEVEVAPECLCAILRPSQRLSQRHKKLFAKQVEQRNREVPAVIAWLFL